MKKLCLFVCLAAAFSLTNCDKDSLDATQTNDSESKLSVSNRALLNGNSVYVSSNTSGVLGIFDISTGLMSPTLKSVNVPYADADGVEYDSNRDAIYQVNRTDSRLVALANISVTSDGDALTPTAIGPSSFTNGRGSSIYNNKVVVADDVIPGRLASYHVNENIINDFREYNVGFKVWDVAVTGKDLYAIEDLTNNLAYYKNFHNAQSGSLSPTSKVSIEGLVRTHGVNYDASTDTMILTDIGSASGLPTSASDGALIIIQSFTQKLNDAGNGGVIALSDQIRIKGDMTQLGNPVDVALSSSKNAIFVAERAQQKFLVFSIPTESCNCPPIYSVAFAGASSVTTDF